MQLSRDVSQINLYIFLSFVDKSTSSGISLIRISVGRIASCASCGGGDFTGVLVVLVVLVFFGLTTATAAAVAAVVATLLLFANNSMVELI